MGKNSLPDRWLPYTPIGKQIEGTKFIAFKVPLNEVMSRQVAPDDRFSPADLIENHPKLQLIIDLTNTTRYYNKMDFLTKGIDYAKIFCPGQIIPPMDVVKKFFDVVDKFISLSKPEDAVIGVHCTHGVNRTGFLICKYMIMRLGIEANEAITRFKDARGHEIEREAYLENLLKTQVDTNINIGTVPVNIFYEESSKLDLNNVENRRGIQHKRKFPERHHDRKRTPPKRTYYDDDNNRYRRDSRRGENRQGDPFYRNQDHASSSHANSYNREDRLGRVSQLNYYEEDSNSLRFSRYRGRGGRGGRGNYSNSQYSNRQYNRDNRHQSENQGSSWGDISSGDRSFSHESHKRKTDYGSNNNRRKFHKH